MTLGSLGLATAAFCASAIAAQCGAGQITQVIAGQQMQGLALLLLALCVSRGDAALAYTLATCGSGLAMVNAASLLARLLRTFEHDPRHHAETLAALFTADYALGYGLASQVGGALARGIGFRATALAYAATAGAAPLALLFLRPACLRRALVPTHALHQCAADAAAKPKKLADAPPARPLGSWHPWAARTLPAEAAAAKGVAPVA